ncbi:uncharacterized protein LOC131153324 [Malania oleifera]|uniref:uncharacterized protein LOC131153324 n=1 Tax=Malania oleifera TaxID=397392 RepID=UPI0025ADEA75|nr:uncharacterized protein LOC131153324 [Malania oleifera]
MEDWNLIAADCVVVSCCCQCLIIQILIFLLLRLPHKVIRKAKGYAKKLRQGKREKKTERENSRYRDEISGVHEQSLRFQVEGLLRDECNGCGCCMEEVERVLEELSLKGEFGFGSFWGRKESESSPTCIAKERFDHDFVQYHLIEMFGPISCP